ncbi:MAG: hypothetical protein EOP06_15600, partial [Proteobacteria bacterium]
MSNQFSRCFRTISIIGVVSGLCLPLIGQSPELPRPKIRVPQLVLQVGPTGFTTATAASPNGRTVAFGGIDRTIRLWDARSGQLKRVLPEIQNAPLMLAFSADNKKLLSADVPERLMLNGLVNRDRLYFRVWDVSTGQQISTSRGQRDVVTAVVSPDWKIVAQAQAGRRTPTGWLPGAVTLSERGSGKVLRNLSGAGEKVPNLVFSPDDFTLAGVGWEGSRVQAVGEPWRNPILLWNVRTGRLTKTLTSQDNIKAAAFSPDGKTLVSVGFSEAKSGDHRATYRLQIWDVKRGKLLKTVANVPKATTSLSFASDGQTLLSRNPERITFWNTQTWKPRRSIQQVGMIFEGAAFTSPNQITALSRLEFRSNGRIDELRQVKMWDVSAGKERGISPNGHVLSQRLLSSNQDADGTT